MAADASGHRDRWIEIITTVLLALAAVATAWATYQGLRWRGEQATATIRGNAARIESTRASGLANRQIQIDVATFIQWVDAYYTRETELADFYFRRFRDEFKPAVTAWIATRPLRNRDAPLTPFVMPQYKPAAIADAERLEARAEAASAEARVDIERADRYALCTVIFATALFFAGVSTRLGGEGSRTAILAIGCLLFLGAIVWMSTFKVSVDF